MQFSEFLSNDDPASNDSSKQHPVSTGSSEVLSENHPVQNSEFLSSDDPASNDSSTQHPVSTGSSEVLTVNQQRTDIQNLLSSLGIISKKWTLENNFHAKFTVEGAKDNIRTRALLVVLSSFLHHRSNDQQHPQTRRIEELFSKFVQSFKPATKVIPFTSVDETELSDFQYLCECSYDSQRDNFIQEVSKVVSEAIQDEEVAPHSSRCLFLLKIGSARTEKTDSSYALPLSIPVTSSFVLQVAAAIYHLLSGNSGDSLNRLVATFAGHLCIVVDITSSQQLKIRVR